jgi:hypothetical protein
MTLKGTVAAVRESLRECPGVTFSVLWNGVLLFIALAAMPFDHRQILGLNPWIKPAKFDSSVIVFLLTVGLMLWALGRDNSWRRSRWLIGWGVGVAMIVEDTIIQLQSARGVRSHMNYDSVPDAILFAIMGLFIAFNSAIAAWLFALWCIAKTNWKPVVVWGIRLGLLMLLAASAEGVRIVAQGGHTVGAHDGGPGLPLINWSTSHGDLRVAHFFALHALQIFPLAALALATTRLRQQLQLSLLFAFSIAYSAGVWWLFVQAVSGLPFVPT